MNNEFELMDITSIDNNNIKKITMNYLDRFDEILLDLLNEQIFTNKMPEHIEEKINNILKNEKEKLDKKYM